MLEMAILETQIFKNFGASMPPDPPIKLAPSALVDAPPLPLLKIKHFLKKLVTKLLLRQATALARLYVTNQVGKVE